jgi:hypothetical protein
LEEKARELNRKYTDEKVNWYVETDGKETKVYIPLLFRIILIIINISILKTISA